MKTLKITNKWDLEKAIDITNNIVFCTAVEVLGKEDMGFAIENQIRNWGNKNIDHACYIATRCCELIQAGMLEVVEVEETLK